MQGVLNSTGCDLALASVSKTSPFRHRRADPSYQSRFLKESARRIVYFYAGGLSNESPMAANIVSTIFQSLTPDLLTRIASALGLDKYLVEKAVSAAVPGLLAIFASRATSREGAGALDRAVASQQPGILTKLNIDLGGAGQSSFIDSGLRALESSLGGSSTSMLSNAISRYSDIGDTNSKSLIVKVGNVDLGGQLTDTVNGIRSTLDSIKDEATAEKAVPALTDSGKEVHRVTGLINQLSPDVRKSLSGATASIRPAIDEMLARALAIPGVGKVVQPAVDTIRSELDTLAAA